MMGKKRHDFQWDSSNPDCLGNAWERKFLIKYADIEMCRVTVQLAVVSELCESKKQLPNEINMKEYQRTTSQHPAD